MSEQHFHGPINITGGQNFNQLEFPFEGHTKTLTAKFKPSQAELIEKLRVKLGYADRSAFLRDCVIHGARLLSSFPDLIKR